MYYVLLISFPSTAPQVVVLLTANNTLFRDFAVISGHQGPLFAIHNKYVMSLVLQG